jgi:hypothetical protein
MASVLLVWKISLQRKSKVSVPIRFKLKSRCRPTLGESRDGSLIRKEFVKEGGKNREGYRKSEAQVGNSQMYDEKAMDEALRRCLKLGYATIPVFMIFSGLKRDSAKAYLDSLCKGDHPRLWKVRESRRWLYFPKKDTSTE